jgi:hypothetical protein
MYNGVWIRVQICNRRDLTQIIHTRVVQSPTHTTKTQTTKTVLRSSQTAERDGKIPTFQFSNKQPRRVIQTKSTSHNHNHQVFSINMNAAPDLVGILPLGPVHVPPERPKAIKRPGQERMYKPHPKGRAEAKRQRCLKCVIRMSTCHPFADHGVTQVGNIAIGKTDQGTKHTVQQHMFNIHSHRLWVRWTFVGREGVSNTKRVPDGDDIDPQDTSGNTVSIVIHDQAHHAVD